MIEYKDYSIQICSDCVIIRKGDWFTQVDTEQEAIDLINVIIES